MSIITSELSKKVGWVKGNEPVYPNNADVVANASPEVLLRWYRFLPTPVNHKQTNLMSLICHRVNNEESK